MLNEMGRESWARLDSSTSEGPGHMVHGGRRRNGQEERGVTPWGTWTLPWDFSMPQGERPGHHAMLDSKQDGLSGDSGLCSLPWGLW